MSNDTPRDLADEILEYFMRHPGEPLTHDDVAMALGVKKTSQAYGRAFRRARWKALEEEMYLTPCNSYNEIFLLVPGEEEGKAYDSTRRSFRDAATRTRNVRAYAEWGAAHADDPIDRSMYRVMRLALNFSEDMAEEVERMSDEIQQQREAREAS